ncbi:MAG: GAF domain-containing protein [Desulfobacteraceae bacterium]|nr:GAF domain-containing protein [Desulfobacteraceae bacterium]
MKAFKTPQETVSTLHNIFAIEQSLTGIDYLESIAKNIAQSLEIKYVVIGHAVEPEKRSIQTDVVWAENDFVKNFIYSLDGTPCEKVLSGDRVCLYPEEVAIRFPKDFLLAEMGVESYIGAPVLNRDGDLTSLLVLLHDKKVGKQDFYKEMVEFLAMRIGAELDKFYIEDHLKIQVAEQTSALKESNQKLQQALNEVKQLSGLLPICSHCKKIRDDSGYWNSIEQYITEHSEAQFSHGICSDCMKEHYSDLDT